MSVGLLYEIWTSHDNDCTIPQLQIGSRAAQYYVMFQEAQAQHICTYGEMPPYGQTTHTHFNLSIDFSAENSYSGNHTLTTCNSATAASEASPLGISNYFLREVDNFRFKPRGNLSLGSIALGALEAMSPQRIISSSAVPFSDFFFNHGLA